MTENTMIPLDSNYHTLFYNKQIYSWKVYIGITFYYIRIQKVKCLCGVVPFTLLCSMSSLNLSTYKKRRNSILLASSNILLCT